MPVPYSPPNVGSYTWTPSHHYSFSAVGAQITSLRSDDLVVHKLHACRCEWWRRLVSPSTGGDWWATCHDQSCTQYSRLWCGIRVSPLLPPQFTSESVHLGQQLRALFLETHVEKNKEKSGVSMSLSVPLSKGDRVRTRDRQIGLQYVHCVHVYICVVVLFLYPSFFFPFLRWQIPSFIIEPSG